MKNKINVSLLKEVARRITLGLRQSDTAARLGGDEFGLILTRVNERSGALLVMKRLLERIEEPFVFEGTELTLGVSAGLSVFPDDGKEIDVLLEQADKWMYEEKRLRKQKSPSYLFTSINTDQHTSVFKN